ncbi:unnamed protein product [Protopolystoma xenopodis]|uniref:Uncharacterized protein n=1 Tax=Protopolystoma xenopodis TaxID=117903 RepID=A0A448WQP8_9PLAT|nr:unnamed protein product [Protopolystoma xenopodis]
MFVHISCRFSSQKYLATLDLSIDYSGWHLVTVFAGSPMALLANRLGVKWCREPIVYNLLPGQMSQHFFVDSRSGSVYVNSTLDPSVFLRTSTLTVGLRNTNF